MRDYSNVTADIDAMIDAEVATAVAAAGAQSATGGISADQEAADIAAAVKPLNDQIAALQVDDQAKADLAAGLQATIDKIKAALA